MHRVNFLLDTQCITHFSVVRFFVEILVKMCNFHVKQSVITYQAHMKMYNTETSLLFSNGDYLELNAPSNESNKMKLLHI